MYKPATMSDQGTAMPKVFNSWQTNFRGDDDPMGVLRMYDNELLAEVYHKMSDTVTDLATFDPALRRSLLSVPPKIEVWHSYSNLNSNITTFRTGKDGKFMIIEESATFWPPAAFFSREKATATKLRTPAGYMLQHPTAEELMTGIAKEWAHVLANHQAEKDSCELLVNVTSAAMAAAAMLGGTFLLPLLIAACVTAVNQRGFTEQVLHRQQVYEADAIAAVISTASGATPDSVTTAMQRAYYADAIFSNKVASLHTCQQRAQWHLAKLRVLLPHSQVPQDAITDSTGLQRVIKAAASEINSASQLVRAEYAESTAALQDCVAEEL